MILKLRSAIYGLIGFSVTIIFIPGLMDPFNFPKFAILVFGVALAFAVTKFEVSSLKADFSKKWHVPLLVCSALLIASIAINVASSRDRYISAYGYFGKYTGAITYIAWILLLIVIALNVSRISLTNVLIWFNRSGILVISYGVIQYLNLDPIKWQELNEGLFSSLGNPNFFGAFAAIFFTFKFAEIMSNSSRPKIVGILCLAAICFVGLQSQSLQFGVIGATGTLLVLLLRFRNSKVFVIMSGLSLMFMIPLGVIGLSGRGPFSTFLFQPSNIYRWDYWRIGINQFLDRPFLGQGMELYGQYFRIFRDLNQVNNAEINHTSDSAHNLIIHSLAVGGVTFTIPFLAILTLIALKVLRDLQTVKSFDSISTIGVIWLLLLLQNLISVDNIALSTWSWIFGGLILQKQKHMEVSRPTKGNVPILPSKESKAMYGIATKSILIFPMVLMLFYRPTNTQIEMGQIFYQPVNAEFETTTSAKESLISNIIDREPENLFNYRLGANTLFIDGNFSQSATVASMGAELFPDDYVVWWFWAKSLEEDGKFEEAIYPRSRTIKLDPWNYSNYYLQGLNYLAAGDLNAARKMRDYLKTLAQSSNEYMDLNSKVSN